MPKAGSKPGAPGEGRRAAKERNRGSSQGRDSRHGRGPRRAQEMEAGQRGAQKLPPPGKEPGYEQGPGPAKAPDGGRREEAAASRGGEEERGEEGRAAGPLHASPGQAGLPGGGDAGSAGRTQGEVSSCFPWLQRRGGEGAGTLAPGQGDSFFLCLKRRRCRLEERGGAGGWRLGAVPAPDARPARTRRRAGHFPEGPHLGQPARPPDSSGRGGEVGLDLCLLH